MMKRSLSTGSDFSNRSSSGRVSLFTIPEMASLLNVFMWLGLKITSYHHYAATKFIVSQLVTTSNISDVIHC